MNKDFSCLVEFIKRETDNMRLNNYYYSMGKTSKNAGARMIDRIFGHVMLFVLGYTGSYLLIKDFFASFVPALIVSIAYYNVEKRIRRKRTEAGKQKIIKEALLSRFSAAVEGKSEAEFYALMAGALTKCGSFSGLKTEFDSSGRPILMIGRLKGRSMGIRCRKTDGDQKVDAEALAEFVELCKARGLSAGVYITTSELDYSARDFLMQLKDFSLYISDMETIYNNFLSKGFLFSVEEVKGDLEKRILYQSRKRGDVLRKILTVRRAWVYISLGCLIAFYSKAAPFSRYYLFVSAVLFSLSLTAIARWRIEKIKEAAGDARRLEKVL